MLLFFNPVTKEDFDMEKDRSNSSVFCLVSKQRRQYRERERGVHSNNKKGGRQWDSSRI